MAGRPWQRREARSLEQIAKLQLRNPFIHHRPQVLPTLGAGFNHPPTIMDEILETRRLINFERAEMCTHDPEHVWAYEKLLAVHVRDLRNLAAMLDREERLTKAGG